MIRREEGGREGKKRRKEGKKCLKSSIGTMEDSYMFRWGCVSAGKK